ncbi:MAG: hypothetical protein CVU56_14680 [Deltaproteobacteria bacterium HGW-Deltaproteobacteria-14]|jgi:predicted ester cyclase|nr:MAG: hypothetical protein CVU56_14680 [Deltaproteobacteria bacterium HGW-Deltaproteobacteria-14]
MRRAAFALVALAAGLNGGCGKPSVPSAPPPGPPPGDVVSASVDPAPATTAPAAAADAAVSPTSDAAAYVPVPLEHPPNPPTSARAVALAASVARYNAHAFDEAYADMVDGVVVRQIGDPIAPVLTGRAALVARDRAMAEAATYYAIVAERLYEAGDWIIVDGVIWGKQDAPLFGHPASHRRFGVAVIWAYHYTADDKIDRVDRFFDDAALLYQLGHLEPVPGARTRLQAAPTDDAIESTEGAPNTANEALVARIEAAFADGTVDAQWDALFSPGFVFDNVNETNRITTKDEYLQYRRAPTELGVQRTPAARLERVLSVDDRVLTWSEHPGTYTGEGVATVPKGTEVTVHTFDLWTVADGKVKSLRSFGNGLEAMAQLGMLPGAAPTP